MSAYANNSDINSMRKIFEKELKNKLSMRTVGRQSEETVLLKAFKYFDLKNLGTCDVTNFIKTMMKIGITGFTEDKLEQVYNIYEPNQKLLLNYKDLVGLLYNNSSVMDNPGKLAANQPEKSRSETSSCITGEERIPKKENKENRKLEDLLEVIRDYIKENGIKSLITLENNFRVLDEDNSQTIDLDGFQNISSRFGLSLNELETVFKFFDKENTGKIDYDEFIRAIRGNMSNSRKELVEYVFNSLNPNGEGIVHIDKIYQNYLSDNHPDVLSKKRTGDEVLNEFISTFDGNHNYLNGDEAKFGNVDLDEFLDYHDSLSMTIEKDNDFSNLIKSVWLNEICSKSQSQSQRSSKAQLNKNNCEEKSLKNFRKMKNNLTSKENSHICQDDQEVDDNEYNNNLNINQEKEELENKKNIEEEEQINNKEEDINENKDDNLQKELNEGLDLFKQYLKQNGAKTILTLARQFKLMDDNGSKTIDFNEFSKGLVSAGLNIPEEVTQELFNDFDYNNNGFINYHEFFVKILGELNPRRENVVKAAFNKLDIDNSGVIELSEIKNFYCTKNNPQVLNGEIDEEELYTHFIETFTNHHNLFSGIRDKRVTFKEFLNYYKYVSFCIPSDDLFESIIISAWRLENIPDYIQTSKREDQMKQKQFEHTIEEKQENLKNRKNNTSIKNGGAPFGIDNDPTDYSTSNYMQDGQNQKLKGNKKVKNEQQQQNEIRDNLSQYSHSRSQRSNPITGVVEDDKNYNSNNYNINEKKSNIIKQGSSKQPIQQSLDGFKEKIKQRGTRGIMSLRRCFMIDDEGSSHLLTFDNFIKYLTNYLIPIDRKEAELIFNYFDDKNKGEIKYDLLIKELLGKMKESRIKIITKAFNKMDKNNQGVINMGIIRSSYLAKEHPDVINGIRSEQDVLGEFLDNFDYHFNLLNPNRNPDDEEVTLSEFIEFYSYISFCIDDDYYFNQIITNVYGLLPNNRKNY